MSGFSTAPMMRVARKISGLSPEEFERALRLIGFVLLAILLLGGLAELYRGYLRLDRLEQETEILMKLAEAHEHVATSRDSQLADAYLDLRTRLERSAEGPPGIPQVGAPSVSPRAEQIFFGMLPWLIFGGLIVLVPAFQTDQGKGQFLSGLLVFLTIWFIPWLFVPLDWPPSIRKWALPFGSAIIVGFVISRYAGSDE